jgi:peptidoglycan/LPS O-acetylase OafA/YrhL
MDGLLIGVAIAAIFNFKPRIKGFLTRYGNATLMLGIILFIVAYQVCESLIAYNALIFGLPLISLAYGVILIGAISPTSILYKMKSRITLAIATLSYAVYLTHKQLYEFVKTILQGVGNDFLQENSFLICLVTALVGGLVLHIVVEKPFLRLRDKVLNRVQADQEIKGSLLLNYIRLIKDKRARP